MTGLALRDKVARGAILLGSTRLLARALDLVTLMVLTRCLLPQDFGIVALSLSIMQVAEAVLELPTGQVLMRLPAIRRSHLDTALTIALIRGIAIAAVLALLSVPFAHFYGDQRLVALVCAIAVAPLFRGLRSPKLVLLYRRLRFKEDGYSEFAGKLAALAVAATLAITTGSYWAIAAGTIASPVVSAAVSFVLVPYRLRLTLQHWRLFHHIIGWNVAGQTISALNWQADRFVLGRLATHAVLGLFSTAREFAAITYKVLFDTLQRPIFSALAAASHDPERFRDVYRKTISATFSIALPVTLGQALVAPELVRLFLGNRWMIAVPVFQIISLTLIPGLYSSLTANLFLAAGRPELVFKRNLQDFAFRIPAAILLIKWYGLYGALGALVAADVLLAVLCMRSVSKLIGLSVFSQIWALHRGLVSAVIMVAAILATRQMTPVADTVAAAVAGLAIVVPLAALAYVGAHLIAWTVSGKPTGIEEVGLRIAHTALARMPGMTNPGPAR
ncbi:oligosaccharide flippase family protein [Novosphingobium sp.]|uniref:oligosaccharide flippase family protein n=1 Tax=Novosphingobium sp. TaxID=1874826 RepID=UPI0025E383A1|nr:oligosaccharide flippase family protein [Novosphingobium sp.]